MQRLLSPLSLHMKTQCIPTTIRATQAGNSDPQHNDAHGIQHCFCKSAHWRLISQVREGKQCCGGSALCVPCPIHCVSSVGTACPFCLGQRRSTSEATTELWAVPMCSTALYLTSRPSFIWLSFFSRALCRFCRVLSFLEFELSVLGVWVSAA